MSVLISIIMPVYNCEKYLPDSLKALLCQSLKDIEILCIDDGSTDSSLALLEEIAKTDDRIKVFHQKNSSPGTARNVGLSNATGKYLMFCDSDDTYTPDMCRIMYETIENNDVDCVLCGAYCINTAGIKREEDTEYRFFKYKGILDMSDNIFINHVNGLLWNKIFKMKIINDYGISFPQIYQYEDECFISQYCAVSSRCMFISDCLYNHFLYENSIIGREVLCCNINNFAVLHSAKYYYNFMIENNLTDVKSKRLLYRMLYICLHYGIKKWAKEGKIKAKSMAMDMFPKDLMPYLFPEYEKTFFKFISIRILRVFSEGKIKKRFMLSIFDKCLFRFSRSIKTV